MPPPWHPRPAPPAPPRLRVPLPGTVPAVAAAATAKATDNFPRTPRPTSMLGGLIRPVTSAYGFHRKRPEVTHSTLASMREQPLERLQRATKLPKIANKPVGAAETRVADDPVSLREADTGPQTTYSKPPVTV
ncbi:uncharacterized protein LY79DRAFT_671576 [Colletotrichum navitas]|uniref:Uncharacterized protein n=1 Tax=Colletotrichum navitas TaxID=681940 RepID=A0AAD8PTW8_9PEZI|nr:uncharacterized protein LY79DRAFT_671576 [Colletotrichum navitas]KAK1580681.1 hypothetical protein LY79DRAFT_671576 [Colletotrichum navitas]